MWKLFSVLKPLFNLHRISYDFNFFISGKYQVTKFWSKNLVNYYKHWKWEKYIALKKKNELQFLFIAYKDILSIPVNKYIIPEYQKYCWHQARKLKNKNNFVNICKIEHKLMFACF